MNPENSKIDCNSGGQVEEVGSGNLEVGSGTRRRQIGLDYAAAKDAEVGIRKWEFGSGNSEVGKVKHWAEGRRQIAKNRWQGRMIDDRCQDTQLLQPFRG